MDWCQTLPGNELFRQQMFSSSVIQLPGKAVRVNSCSSITKRSDELIIDGEKKGRGKS